MSSFDRQAILDCLSRLVTPGIKLTALADELGVRKQDYDALREQLLDLVEEGIVHVLPGGAFALAPIGPARRSAGQARGDTAAPKPPTRPLKAIKAIRSYAKPNSRRHLCSRNARPLRTATRLRAESPRSRAIGAPRHKSPLTPSP